MSCRILSNALDISNKTMMETFLLSIAWSNWSVTYNRAVSVEWSFLFPLWCAASLLLKWGALRDETKTAAKETRLYVYNYDNVNTVFSSLARIHAKSILMLMKYLSVARRISGISRLQYVGQQGQKSDSLARKQSTNGFLKCKQESKTMLDRWNIKLTL